MAKLTKRAMIVLLFSLSVTAAFLLGNASGLYFYPKLSAETETAGDHDHELDHAEEDHLETDHEEADHEEEGDHVALTEQAFANLHLKLGPFKRGDYWKSRTLPGQVIEIPGMSELSVPAPVTGVVERVLLQQGQSIGEKEQIAELRITDEELTRSQSKLLSTLARQDVVREEIARLQPLTSSGTISGGRQRELEYELRQLVADQQTNMQEIRARGLPKSVLETLVSSRSLANRLYVALPDFSKATQLTPTVEIDSPTNDQLPYSVESLDVHPGKAVQRGETLCRLSFHLQLHIRGTAFEADLPVLQTISDRNWTISAEFGHVHHKGHSHRQKLDDLRLLRVNNHVTADSQTFDFYLPIQNRVERAIKDDEGRIYQQWSFKPGQRVHLRLPEELWENQILIPSDAVVVEGPNAFVFVEHHHEEEDDVSHAEEPHNVAHDDHEHDHEHDHDHEHEIYVELEPVSVRLLHRDSHVAVIADDGQVHEDDRIALNNAFKLHLAMEMQGGGGGHHHHHHDH